MSAFVALKIEENESIRFGNYYSDLHTSIVKRTEVFVINILNTFPLIIHAYDI
jgi:hypothetical protein